MFWLLGGRYGFRVLVEDPSVPFMVVDRPDRLWSIRTVDKQGGLVDWNYNVIGFAIRERLRCLLGPGRKEAAHHAHRSRCPSLFLRLRVFCLNAL